MFLQEQSQPLLNQERVLSLLLCLCSPCHLNRSSIFPSPTWLFRSYHATICSWPGMKLLWGCYIWPMQSIFILLVKKTQLSSDSNRSTCLAGPSSGEMVGHMSRWDLAGVRGDEVVEVINSIQVPSMTFSLTMVSHTPSTLVTGMLAPATCTCLPACIHVYNSLPS